MHFFHLPLNYHSSLPPPILCCWLRGPLPVQSPKAPRHLPHMPKRVLHDHLISNFFECDVRGRSTLRSLILCPLAPVRPSTTSQSSCWTRRRLAPSSTTATLVQPWLTGKEKTTMTEGSFPDVAFSFLEIGYCFVLLFLLLLFPVGNGCDVLVSYLFLGFCWF